MNLTFYVNDATKSYTLVAIAFQLAAEIFPNGSYDWLELFYFGNTLSAPFGNSYKCGHLKSFPLRLKNENNITGMVELTNIQFEVYRNGLNQNFSTPMHCEMNENSEETTTEDIILNEGTKTMEHQTSTEDNRQEFNEIKTSDGSTKGSQSLSLD